MTTQTQEPKPLMRRRGLIEWLATYGMTPEQVDKLIDDGVIPREYFGAPGGTTKRRAYYSRLKVAEALKISDCGSRIADLNASAVVRNQTLSTPTTTTAR